MKICFATSECVPYVKTGGLADVSDALPKALAKLGCQIKVFLPLYSAIDPDEHGLTPVKALNDLPVQLGSQSVAIKVWHRKCDTLPVEHYFIDYPPYYHRDQIYTSAPDEDERFILLQDAIIRILQELQWAPDIMHCNDWQTALLPAYLKFKFGWDKLFEQTRSVLSIHNIGYQGKFPGSTIRKAGLPEHLFYPTGPFEFYGLFSFLKAGIMFADVLNTVSETYAQEIQTPEYGAGLDGVLRMRKDDLFGILNGIDQQIWNPRTDPFIPYHYNLRNLRSKLKNKQHLLQSANLAYDEQVPAIGIIARLVYQKGLDLLQEVLPQMMERSLQLLVLGTGEQQYEDFFRWAAQTYPDKVFAYIGFNNELAHLITAGCDMFLMPSRYEPCGLNQMDSLNYGTVPVVRKTGGLADTVKDYHESGQDGNGFAFEDYSPVALDKTVQRALEVFPQKAVWKEMMKRGMRADFSWKQSAKKYLALYEKAQQHALVVK